MPTTLQKRFVDADGWLHAFRTSDPNGHVFRRRPEDIFKERELYTTTDSSGLPQRAMEDALSRFESKSAVVLDRIVKAARAGEVPKLTADELAIWIRFFFLQWQRVPDLHLTVTPDLEAEEMLNEIIAEARLIFPHMSEELERHSRPEARARFIKNARVDGLGSMSPTVFEALRSRGIGIARIRRSDKRFVVGSRPVVKLTRPGKADLSHPECELWLPIASDVMVGLGRGAGTETLANCSPDHVRHINLAIVQQSTMFASASARLTQSLARAR